MTRAAKWAVIRAETPDAPEMPWAGDPTAAIFPRLAAQHGTAFALRHWALMVEYAGILEAYPDDESADARREQQAFADRVTEQHGREVLLEFAAVCKLSRIIRGGIERRLTARVALRTQLKRLRCR